MKAVYPNVNWTNFNAGADMTSVFQALTAGQNNWDVARGTGLAWPALGFMEPITDFFNAWADKAAIPPGDVDSGSYKGDVYMLPDDGGPHAGWWRKDLFAEAGAGTFDYKTFTYTGTKPNDMNYSELSQTIAKITQMGSSRSVYGSYIPSNAAILGPWYVDSFIRANGGLRYYGDSQSCTVTMDKAPFYNNVLDSMKFLQSNLPNYVPGGATLDLNALITEITTGSLGFFFGPDPNLDGQMAKTAANKSNPKAPDGVNVRNCIQPTTGWSNGKPLDPKLPPSIKFVSWAGILRGSTNPKASWEWLRTYCGFNAEMGLVGNAAGIPERLDVGKIIASDPKLDIADWIAATTGWTYVDAPIQATFGQILGTSYTNAIDPFVAGTGTAETAVQNFVQAATSGLQKAGIPAAAGPAP
jgi:ABC-type glycerol-3-phosphate transport system substrate-binding protein